MKKSFIEDLSVELQTWSGLQWCFESVMGRIKLLSCYMKVPLTNPDIRGRMQEIASLRSARIETEEENEPERALPGDRRFNNSLWHRFMFARYLFALPFVEGKVVLDTCSGLGWGTYLIATRSKLAVGLDISEDAVHSAKRNWKTRNLLFQRGDVTHLPFADATFDVALAYESIEHFSREDGTCYLQEIKRVLKPSGTIIGSSSFPASRLRAERLRLNNPHHLTIYTSKEMRNLLRTHFRRFSIIGNMVFWAEGKRF